MNHLFYNHIFTGLFIIFFGIVILWVTIFYIWLQYEEASKSDNSRGKKKSFLILFLENLFGIFLLVVGDLPTGTSLGIFSSVLLFILGGWVLFYGHSPF